MTSRSLRPRTERPRMECVIESVVTKRLGALPVAAEFLRRLDVAGIVDALCPPDPRAELTHGPAAKARAGRPAAPAGRSPGAAAGAR